MVPSVIEDSRPAPRTTCDSDDILALRKALTSESVPLARRFRALFALKHHACLHPPSAQTLPAIQAIAAAFPSPSALVKHELAYCLGQTGNRAAVPYLRRVLEDTSEDAMCRHEAAEALGALGDQDSLAMLEVIRDRESEPGVVRETCEIAVERIKWDHSKEKRVEKIRQRYVNPGLLYGCENVLIRRSKRFHLYRSCSPPPAIFTCSCDPSAREPVARRTKAAFSAI